MAVIVAVAMALLFICLGAWGFLLLFVGVQETVEVFGKLFDLRVLRRSTRFRRQSTHFRLRTLLLVAAVVQVMFATAAWHHQDGKPFALLLFALGCVTFFAWTIWAVFEDSAAPTASRKWKRYIRARRIVLPDDGDPPPPNRQDA
jgi:hypothetical protein